MSSLVESVNMEQFVILHLNDRYLLYSIVTGKPIVSQPFTLKRLTAYLVDERDAEDDEDEIYSIAVDIAQARNTGVFGCAQTFEECIALNTLGADGKAMPYVQFLTAYFQRGGKDTYRCEQCNESVRVAKDVESFAGNGGSLPVNSFCLNCSSI